MFSFYNVKKKDCVQPYFMCIAPAAYTLQRPGRLPSSGFAQLPLLQAWLSLSLWKEKSCSQYEPEAKGKPPAQRCNSVRASLID